MVGDETLVEIRISTTPLSVRLIAKTWYHVLFAIVPVSSAPFPVPTDQEPVVLLIAEPRLIVSVAEASVATPVATEKVLDDPAVDRVRP